MVELDKAPDFLQSALDSCVDPTVSQVLAAVSGRGGDFLWLGTSSSDESNTAAADDNPQASFRIASVTKTFVAATALRLVEDGRLSLSAPVSGQISDRTGEILRQGGFNPDVITLDHLLCHTAGLRDHVEDSYELAVLENPQRRWTRLEQIERCMALGEPLGTPGERFSYSDTGYVILGEVLERLEDRGFAGVVRDALNFEGLGLNETYWESLEPAPAGTPARGRQFIGGVNATDFDPSLDLFGGGGLVSTTRDLVKFMRAFGDGSLFRRPSTLTAALLIPRALREPDQYLHSRCAMVLPMGDRYGWGHLGYWGCGMAFDPVSDVSVALSIGQAVPQTTDFLVDSLRNIAGATIDVAGHY